MLGQVVEQAQIDAAVKAHQQVQDDHIRETMDWHFRPESGSPFWLAEMKKFDFDPLRDIHGLEDAVRLFPLFDGKVLKTVPGEMFIPRGFKDCKDHGFFVTGGTGDGNPSRRWGRISKDPKGSDCARDYTRLSGMLPNEGFPEGGTCLFIGPQGPRRLKLGCGVLASLRGNAFFEVDLDVVWMKSQNNVAKKAYLDQIVGASIAAIQRDNPVWIFCPPILVMEIGKIFDWSQSSVKGILAGGTEMTPETVRFIMTELLGPGIHFLPIFGNALLGLAPSREIATFDNPIEGQRPFSTIYQPFGPHSIMRVTTPDDPRVDVPYGERGIVVNYTFSTEFMVTGMVERDEAGRERPTLQYPSDGVSEVGPPAHLRNSTVVGVY